MMDDVSLSPSFIIFLLPSAFDVVHVRIVELFSVVGQLAVVPGYAFTDYKAQVGLRQEICRHSVPSTSHYQGAGVGKEIIF